jgi:hypothetical protein
VKRQLIALAAAAALLTGCSSSTSPQAQLQAGVNDLVDAANAHDPAAVRTAGGRLLQLISAQSNNADITITKAQTMKTLVSRVMANAGDLAAQTPSPAPVVTTAPTPVQETTPAPQPTTQAPTPTPQPTHEPTSQPTQVVVPTLGASPQPS